MLKGTISKEIATKKILETFEGSFVYDKEIRIPLIENGETLQLKCVLTCAKVMVGENSENAIPGSNEINFESNDAQIETEKSIEPTQEEKDNVARLAKMLNL